MNARGASPPAKVPGSPRPSLVLVQPRIGHWDELRTAPAAPLGPIHAAACVAPDHDVTLIDQRVEGWKGRLDAALERDPVLVGLSAFTGPMIRHGLGIADHVRRTSDVPLVWGGFHPTFLPAQTLADPRVDYVILGEGERPLAALAHALREGRDPEDVPGVGFVHADGGIRLGKLEVAELDELPDPPFELVDLRDYLLEWGGRPTLNLQASRGCRFRCSFCYHSIGIGTEQFRRVSVDRFVGWVKEHALPAGTRSLYLVDDSFFGDREWAFTLLDALGSLDLTVQLQGVEVSTLHKMSDTDLARMERDGVVRIQTGIETGSDRIRRKIRKPGKLEHAVPVNRRLAKTGMVLQASWITAFPSETIDDLRQTVRLCLQLLRENPHFRSTAIYNYRPYPGTAMFQEAEAAGHRFPKHFAGWARFGWFDATTEGPWTRRERKIFRGIYSATLFLDAKAREHGNSWLVRILERLYRPIAMWRVRNLHFGFYPEGQLVRMMLERKGG